MEQPWKPFADWVTVLKKPNVFLWARLKLTGIYVLILAIVLIGFSAFLYQSLGRNLIDANEENFADQTYHEHFVNETLETVRDEILAIDLFILLLASGVSYVLAGYTLRPIQTALEAQRKFSENASHELRTPLAVVKNDMEVLLRDSHPTKETIEKTLVSSIEEIDHMTTLTEDLLAIARSENQRTDFVRVDLGRVANDLVEKMKPMAERKGIILACASQGAAYVKGHEASLERVLMNLIQNSIEHTSKGGRITVVCKRENTKQIITVTDTGKGIDEKNMPHIFERFYKGEHGTGSGLGLAIVKEIVEKHSGVVEITSVKNQGTTATITFSAA